MVCIHNKQPSNNLTIYKQPTNNPQSLFTYFKQIIQQSTMLLWSSLWFVGCL
jgi:hypothetical protein